ncbi:hypothetical protein GCM10018781_03390 [Kitasatospora indigofera]|uniref:Uncharacterized protein n=1 Tax=Kitasatospora indigofera TaxID=67307 RepID=A0A919KKG8_9ACTN|nr:hypothetical protein [Kitasatospora indigofera]GHH59705.1 hypothetical protein GCM10018781_03390 [Kitasatospora indigofera]
MRSTANDGITTVPTGAAAQLGQALEEPQSTMIRAWSVSTMNLLPVTVPAPPRKVSRPGRGSGG